MYTEEQLLPLSAVAHYVFCSRRFALLHIEQIWTENVLTAEGRLLHEKADSGENESRGDLRILRSLHIRSLRLGVMGIADVVELHRLDLVAGGRAIPGINGTWMPFPVEYKRGAAKSIESYEVQLCAQAICLEEMLGAQIPDGALFLGTRQHRVPVSFDSALRERTETACQEMQQLFVAGTTPHAVYSKRCESCSVIESCQPKSAGTGKPARNWLNEQISSVLHGVSPT